MYEKLKQVLVEEMSINPDDIKRTPSSSATSASTRSSWPTLSCSARRSSTSCLRTPTCPGLLTVRDVVDYLEANA